jgi:hypothetical protein
MDFVGGRVRKGVGNSVAASCLSRLPREIHVNYNKSGYIVIVDIKARGMLWT